MSADDDRWESLGTHGAHIEIVAYDPGWPLVFEREAKAILEECSPWIIPGRYYFDRVVDGRTVVHVHMFPAGHPEVRKHLVFRDHLRAHPDAAQDYERLKRRLASKYRDDRRTYTDAKAEFINMIIDTALPPPTV